MERLKDWELPTEQAARGGGGGSWDSNPDILIPALSSSRPILVLAHCRCSIHAHPPPELHLSLFLCLGLEPGHQGLAALLCPAPLTHPSTHPHS